VWSWSGARRRSGERSESSAAGARATSGVGAVVNVNDVAVANVGAVARGAGEVVVTAGVADTGGWKTLAAGDMLVVHIPRHS